MICVSKKQLMEKKKSSNILSICWLILTFIIMSLFVIHVVLGNKYEAIIDLIFAVIAAVITMGLYFETLLLENRYIMLYSSEARANAKKLNKKHGNKYYMLSE